MSKRATFIAFILAVTVQVIILVAVPARRVLTLANGKRVVLRVQPVDPYSILSGYYVTLGYEINRREVFANGNDFADEGRCYAVLESGEDGVWKPLSLERELPKALPDNRVALAGRIRYGRIDYGIEDFYISESKRREVADDLSNHPNKARVEIKVDGSGNPALERLRIEDRVYE
jgi:uncharacterized membrane-anchored protein